MTGSRRNSYYDSIPMSTESDIMDIVGDNGRWQFCVSVQIFFIMTLVAVHNLSVSFLAPNLDYWCARPAGATNITIQEWKSRALPPHDRHCSRYEVSNLTDFNGYNVSTNQILPCFAWEYDETFYSSTLLSKWNLVCHREWLVSLIKSIFMAGTLISVVVFGHLADRFGRKPIVISASVITCFCTTWCAFTSSVTVFIIIRFFIGVGLGGYYNTAFILLMEIVVPEMRPIYGMGIQLGWCLGFICLPGIAWLIRDAFWIQIALAVPAFLHMIFSWTIPESPRWLLSNGKLDDARRILVRAAEINRIAITNLDRTLEEVMADMKWEDEKNKKRKNLLDLLKTPGLRRMTAFLFLIWFINSFVYFGLSFNTNELSGNPFVNFALSGAMEFPAYFLSIFIIKSAGRRRPLAASMVLGGVICLFLYLIPIDIPQTIVAAAMIGKFFITCSFGILYVFTAELFPTVVRNIGLGSSTVCEGLGSIVAPFIRELGNATHPAIPQFLFGILSIAGGALVIFLPETNNLSIPDTLEEAAQITRGKENN